MTMINCIAGAIYTKSFPVKEKIQLYGMALIFLFLLYNSPAGLVLYWTVNNIFSLAKNILQKQKNAKRIIYILLCIFSALCIVYVLAFHHGYFPKRLLLSVIFSFVFLSPYLLKRIHKSNNKTFLAEADGRDTALYTKAFLYSSVILFLLAGLAIPGEIIASSAEEFSFVESYKSPFPFLFYTFTQAAGLFLFWPIGVFFLAPQKARIAFSLIASFLCLTALVNNLFPGNYGFLTITLFLSNPGYFFSDYQLILFNAIALIIITILFFVIVLLKKQQFLCTFQIIIIVSLAGFSTVKLMAISKTFTKVAIQAEEEGTAAYAETPEPVYSFSRNGKNVLIIMLDRALSGFVPYILDEKPELVTAFDGFTLFPNCASFAGHTYLGAPPLYGGYEYTPEKMNIQTEIPLEIRRDDALLVQPILFHEAGFSVTVTDPPYETDYTKIRFSEHPEINYDKITGKYAATWLKQHPDVQVISISDLLKKKFIRFAFFKMSPSIFRIFIYDRGKYLTTERLRDDINHNTASTTLSIIGFYAELDFLPELTTVTDNASNTFTLIANQLTHDSIFLQAPNYTPATVVTNKGDGPFSNEPYYHVHYASLSMLGEYFAYLQKEGVYDNTRIIIVSDHGGNTLTNPDDFVLPTGEYRQAYSALLMVKDFNERHTLKNDYSFMTNADVPILSTKALIPDTTNPFTKMPLQSDKENGISIATVSAITQHEKYRYNVNKNDWLYVHDNIFDKKNWTTGE
jgi:hypothetical protein